MKHILTITDYDLFKTPTGTRRGNFSYQESSRAIVSDQDKNIALLKTGVYKIHKLPGGSLRPGESAIDACHRECKEELGCKIEILESLGYTDEYKDKRHEHRCSHFYRARVIGDKGEPKLTKFEIKGKFQIVWTTLEHAIELVEKDKPIDYDGHFIRLRELTALKFLKTRLSD